MEAWLAGEVPRSAIAVIGEVILPRLGSRAVQARTKCLVVGSRCGGAKAAAQATTASPTTWCRNHRNRCVGRRHHRHDDGIQSGRRWSGAVATRIVCHDGCRMEVVSWLPIGCGIDGRFVNDPFIRGVCVNRDRDGVHGLIGITLSSPPDCGRGNRSGIFRLGGLAAHSRQSGRCRQSSQRQTQCGSERENSHGAPFGLDFAAQLAVSP